jgi:hypothetical protein
MFTQIKQIENMQPIIDQCKDLAWDNNRSYLNSTDGNLLSGEYQIKDELKGTPLGDLLESLGDIGEARLLKLESGETYTAHTDPDDRLHLVIETNPYCYIINLDDQQMYHFPVDGKLILMDTGVTHVAVNFGGRPRIHLNIRLKLPKYHSPGFLIKVLGGDYDWKQELYIKMMGFLNRSIKQGTVQGIEKVNERELLINCDQSVLDFIKDEAKSKGFDIEITSVVHD